MSSNQGLVTQKSLRQSPQSPFSYSDHRKRVDMIKDLDRIYRKENVAQNSGPGIKADFVRPINKEGPPLIARKQLQKAKRNVSHMQNYQLRNQLPPQE